MLEDETLLTTLSTSKVTSLEVTEQLATSETTEAKIDVAREVVIRVRLLPSVSMMIFVIRMEVASSRPDHLPTLSAAKTSKLSLLVKHHILVIDEAS